MTKIIKREMYCKTCNESFEVPVVMSTNSFMLERDPSLKKKYEDGTLFKNFCPKCGEELIEHKQS